MSYKATEQGSKSDSLRLQVYKRLRHALQRGLLPPDQTATERDLAEQLGVSRTPVREALALLVHEGLISSTGRGFAVPDISTERLTEIFQIRRMLEPPAVALSIDHLSAHDFRTLKAMLAEQQRAHDADDPLAFSEANLAFRLAWLSAVPNQQLRSLIERYNDHTEQLRKVTLMSGATRQTVISGLRQLLAALEEGKPAAASKAMIAHLEAAERCLRDAACELQGERFAA